MTFYRTDRFLGLVLLAAALATLFLWIPLDTDTGMIEKARRRLVIGDAFATTIVAILAAIAAASLAITGKRSEHEFKRDGLMPMLKIIGILVIILLVMRYAGPVAVSAFGALSGETLEYRPLRGTAPIKYIGYLLGGTGLIAALSGFMDGQFTKRRIALAFVITLALALFFDLPFEDILLPPNGDV